MPDFISNPKYRHTAALVFRFFTRRSSGTADASHSKVSSSVSISVSLLSISLSGSIFTVACAHGCVRMRMQCIARLQYYCLLQISAIQISSSSKSQYYCDIAISPSTTHGDLQLHQETEKKWWALANEEVLESVTYLHASVCPPLETLASLSTSHSSIVVS